jgi:hypothetical protein
MSATILPLLGVEPLGQKQLNRLTQQVLAGVAKQRLRPPVDEQDASGGVSHDYRLGTLLDDRLSGDFGFRQRVRLAT